MEYSSIDLNIILNAAQTLKTIAHPVRLRIIEALEKRDCAVGELAEGLECPQAVVSKHLGRLKRAGLVDCRKDCNFRYYFIKKRNVLKIMDCIRTNGPKGE